MDFNNLRSTLATVCWLIALALAIAATLKLGGVIAIRPSVIDLCAASIALALAK
jgi:hypothetical protein